MKSSEYSCLSVEGTHRHTLLFTLISVNKNDFPSGQQFQVFLAKFT